MRLAWRRVATGTKPARRVPPTGTATVPFLSIDADDHGFFEQGKVAQPFSEPVDVRLQLERYDRPHSGIVLTN